MTAGSNWLVGTALAACLIAAPVYAQTPPTQQTPPQQTPTPAPSSGSSNAKASHWGVVFSGTPSWYVPNSIIDKIASGGGATIVGSQFTIGIVRGRAMSGDWGVTFVHERVKDGSNGFSNDTSCGFTNGPISGGCFNTSGAAVAQGVKMNGVQVHKFIPFGTIKRRVQLGLELAGGFGSLSGTLQKTSSDITNVLMNPKTGQRTAVLTTTVTTEDVTAELPNKVPLGHLTVVAAAIITPAIKVRWEGGMLMPGQSFSTIVVTFLFGAHD
jgi:hypothetical protein